MNKIYRFLLSTGTETPHQVFPVYKDDLAIEYALESGEQFYRGKLSGKLTFQSVDYTYIRNKAFDTQFNLTIEISGDAGQTWATYWTGDFWKTDCQIDEDDKTVIVTPNVVDRYTAILAGLEKEFDLIPLAPVIQPVQLDKRPMIQIYVPGQSVIGCFLSGMWWEQTCDVVEESDTVVIEGQTYPAITHKYHFSLNRRELALNITQTGTPTLPKVFHGEYPDNINNFQYSDGGYTIKVVASVLPNYIWQIIRNSDNVVMWEYAGSSTTPVLQPVPGAGATGTVTVTSVRQIPVYARYITDVESAQGVNTYPIPADDLVPDNRNYSRVVGYQNEDSIFITNLLTETPTEWGLYQPGLYYVSPASIGTLGIGEAYPVARATWGSLSVWFIADEADWSTEQRWRKSYTLKDAYPLWSVISVLLGKIAPGVSHGSTAAYSTFLYDTNPISNIQQTVFITPKSNIIASGYDQPAQKAPITMRQVLNMLRDCFRCYWFIDDSNRFRIEHIEYFRRGGSYTGTPVIGMDLTEQKVSRNGKPWSYARNNYQFDKPDMTARYQFGWMDDVTQLFEGYPIDIVSKYVDPAKIENISIAQFTSDIDYILLNPGDISRDGFVLLGAMQELGVYKLPYINFRINFVDHILQNAWMAFYFLQQYYAYDMPARDYQINGVSYVASGVKRLKTQTLKFPVLNEPNMTNLIKTGLGNGQIQKMSVNLSSRNANATLIYDTE